MRRSGDRGDQARTAASNNVIEFRKRSVHAEAPLGASLKPNSAGSTVCPFASKASRKTRKRSLGIAPRAFQLETAGHLTPTSAATAEVPPKASITASTVRSMNQEYSRYVNMSSLHALGIFTLCELRPYSAMGRTTKDIAARLVLVRDALGISDAELCRRSGIATNAWSQYLNKRRISIAAMYKLLDTFGVPLQYVLNDDMRQMPLEMAQKITAMKRGDIPPSTPQPARGRPRKVA